MERLKRSIQQILKDQTSGSAALLDRLMDSFLAAGKTGKFLLNKEEIIDLLKKQLTNFRDFPVVLHFLTFLLQHSAWEKADNITQYIESYSEKWAHTGIRIAKKVREQIGPGSSTILLHSSSKTLFTFFEVNADLKNVLRVIQTESRPMLEGRNQAARIAKLGFEITLIPDLYVGSYLKDIDYIFLGADRVCKEYFINKAGSLSLALLAKTYKIPVLVLADSRKIMQEADCREYQEKLKDPKGIWAEAPAGILIENFYFETIPNTLVTGFITDEESSS